MKGPLASDPRPGPLRGLAASPKAVMARVSAYLYAAGTLALALLVAAVVLGREHSLPRPVAAAVRVLRGLHNGRPGDYVAWTVAGVALLGSVFALALQ